MPKTIVTGSRRIVANVWTEEAREASAAARKGGRGAQAEKAFAARDHRDAEIYHMAKSKALDKAGDSHLADLHAKAAGAHEEAAYGSRAGKSQTERAEMSSKARDASLKAHAAGNALKPGDRVKGYGETTPKSTMGPAMGTVAKNHTRAGGNDDHVDVKWDSASHGTRMHSSGELKRI